MKKSKTAVMALFSCLILLFMNCGVLFAAPAKDAKYSVDAEEIEYDMESGDGTAAGKTTIKHDGGTAVAQKGATFNSKNRTGHLFGGVTADHGDQHMTSQELFLYTDKYISAVGNAVVVKGERKLEAPRVDYHDDTKFAETLGGSARLSSTDGSWLTAGKITYNMETGLANATGGVNLESIPRKLQASGDTAVYDDKETGYIEMIGNAKATQDGNTVTGNRIRITNTSRQNTMTRVEGNVRIVLVPRENRTEINSPAFGEGAVMMADGKTDFNPEHNLMDRVAGNKSDTEEQAA